MKASSIAVLLGSIAISLWISRPMLADVVGRRAVDEETRGNFAQAERLDRRALAIYGRSVTAAGSLVRIERGSGRNQDAIRDATLFIRVAGYSRDVVAERGRSYFGERAYAAAAGDFEAIVSHQEGTGMDALFGIYALRHQGRFDQARALAKNALKANPNDARLKAYAGVVL